MRNIFRSLVWKEWHEHKWKLAAITVIMLGVTSMAMVIADEEKFGPAVTGMVLCSLVLAVFVGLGTAASERSRGTLPFLQALPVPMWKAAVAKFVAGAVTVVLPICVTVFSFYLWRRGFDALEIPYSARDMDRPSNWYVATGLLYGTIATSLWLWSAAAGINRRDEISAGAVALAVMVGWSVVIVFVAERLHEFGLGVVAAVLSGLAPGGVIFANIGAAPGQHFLLFLATTCATHCVLVVWYVRRFGQVSEREITSPLAARSIANRADWLGPPRRSAATAVAWKQMRESGPIALAGLAGIFGITLLLFAVERAPTQLAEFYSGVAVTMGFAIALVVGIGVALNDSKPQVNTFWRSRPINPSLWYWMKYAIGLVIVLVTIYAPIWLVAGWGESLIHDPEAQLILPPVHIALFAAAVAMTCLARHAIYAAILSIGALLIGVHVAWLAWLALRWIAFERYSVGDDEWPLDQPVVVAAGLLLCFVVCTVLGWLAMRNDWGWKSRY